MERNYEDKEKDAAQAPEHFPMLVYFGYYSTHCDKLNCQTEYRRSDHQF